MRLKCAEPNHLHMCEMNTMWPLEEFSQSELLLPFMRKQTVIFFYTVTKYILASETDKDTEVVTFLILLLASMCVTYLQELSRIIDLCQRAVS